MDANDLNKLTNDLNQQLLMIQLHQQQMDGVHGRPPTSGAPRPPVWMYIVAIVIIVGLFFASFAMATDGTNGTSGPAMLDYDTDQLFDSQHPNHTLVVAGQTLTLTGHGTVTLGDANAKVYAGSNIILRGTDTTTSTALATTNGTGTATNTGTGSCTSTVSVYGTVTGTSGATATASGLTTASGACTATLTATAMVGGTVTNTSTVTSTVTATSTGALSSYFVSSRSSGTQNYLPQWLTPYELTDSPVSWAGGADPVSVNADLQCVGDVSAANIVTTPAAYGIPKADDANKIADGWLEDHYLYGVGGIAFSYKTGTDTVTSTGTVVNTKLNPTISNTSTFTATTTSVATHTFRSVNSNLLFGSDSNSVTATETAVTTDVYVFINAKTASATYSIPQSGSSGKLDNGWLNTGTAPAASSMPLAGTDAKIGIGWLPNGATSTIIPFYSGDTFTVSPGTSSTRGMVYIDTTNYFSGISSWYLVICWKQNGGTAATANISCGGSPGNDATVDRTDDVWTCGQASYTTFLSSTTSRCWVNVSAAANVTSLTVGSIYVIGK